MLKIKSRFFKSLRFRIMLMLVVMGIVPSLIVSASVIKTYEDRAVSLRFSNVRSQCDILCNQLVRMHYMESPDSKVISGKLNLLGNFYLGRILVIDQNFRIVKDTFDLDEGKTVISPDVIECFQGKSVTSYNEKNGYLQMTVPVKSSGSKEIQGVMLISISSSEISATIEMLRKNEAIILGLLVILVLLIGYLLSGFLVKPFSKVTKSIEALTDGYQNDEIEVLDYTETELITDAFNKVLNRMKILDESRQEFVSNVSHELKTPLTSMKVLADSLVGQENVPVELYQEFMQDITNEIDRENKIITDLLSLVKMDKTSTDLNIQRMNMNDLLETILKRLRPIADKRKIDLILDSFRLVEAEVDEVKFTLAISNLVENGIKYNVDEGWVRVSLDADHKYFYVTVSDSGMGIPEDSLERIFERFYRVDKSHSREIGGTGLGLAITKNAVVMHHGAIRVSSKEGEGTTFSIRIPLRYVS